MLPPGIPCLQNFTKPHPPHDSYFGLNSFRHSSEHIVNIFLQFSISHWITQEVAKFDLTTITLSQLAQFIIMCFIEWGKDTLMVQYP
jgi:hypothetical protein